MNTLLMKVSQKSLARPLSTYEFVLYGHFKSVVTNDQTRQLVISKDLIGMRFSSSLIRIDFKDEITTFNPYIMIESNHNYLFEYSIK